MSKRDTARELKNALGVGPIPLDLLTGGASNEKGDAVSFLVFELAETVFAIAVGETEGVVECPSVSPLPSPPDGVVGVASVRGRITIVMDLSLQPSLDLVKRRLILVKGDARLGLLADRIAGVVTLNPTEVRAFGKSARSTGERRTTPWPVRGYFENGRRRVPIINIEEMVEI